MRHFLYTLFVLISVQVLGQTNGSIKALYKTAIIENDLGSQKTLSKQLKTEYSTNILNYYKKLLEVVPSNSILVTNELEDTYPVLAIQNTESIEKNVKVVSLGLLKEEKYLTHIFKSLNLSLEFDKTGTSIYLSRILLSKRKVLVSNTVNPDYYVNYSSQMFVVGLALEYQCQDQYNQLEQFWSLLQKKNKYKFNLSSQEKGIYSNYLPPLLTLYKLKLEGGVKDESLKLGIQYLGQLLDKSIQVKNIIKQYEKGG